MGVNVEQYRDMLAALLPQGAAWLREPGRQLMQLLSAWADEFARCDSRAEDLREEVDPRAALEMVDDWERVLGLPQTCDTVVSATLQERRNAVVSKLTSIGGQTPAYYIQVADALGYPVTVSEYGPFTAGSSAGNDLTNDTWAFTWMINAPETTLFSFSAGQSIAGDPVRAWGADRLECAINHLRPSHTTVNFSYGA